MMRLALSLFYLAIFALSMNIALAAGNANSNDDNGQSTTLFDAAKSKWQSTRHPNVESIEDIKEHGLSKHRSAKADSDKASETTRILSNLKLQNQQAQEEITALREQVRLNKSSNSRMWLITGAAIFLFGIVVGVVLSSIREKRKRSNWGGPI